MASNNRLYRNFVILQEDERGYSNSSDKSLSGYSKIEAKGDKCKISFYAQNLKKDSDSYYMMIICCKKDMKQIINLAQIEVSETGKAEATKEYNISNIGGLDIQFDKISGTAIAKIKDGIPIFVMCGFLNGQQPSENWKNYTLVKAKEVRVRATEKVAEKEHKKDSRKPEIKIEKSKEKSKEKSALEAKVVEETILENTESTRVKTVKFGNHELSGVETRTLLGLKSTNFEITREDDKIKFSVKGYGHGVGMSQTGADAMAKQGRNSEEIIKHFYTGVEISDVNIL